MKKLAFILERSFVRFRRLPLGSLVDVLARGVRTQHGRLVVDVVGGDPVHGGREVEGRQAGLLGGGKSEHGTSASSL